MADTLADEIIGLLDPLASEHGLELVAVEVSGGGRGQVVRLYIDREGGIDIDSIAAANEWISEALEPVRRLHEAYTLEVSSPGIERILRKRSDFERFAGRTAVVKTSEKILGRAAFTGVLKGIEEEMIVIDADGIVYRLPLEKVERARLKYDFDGLSERM